MLNGIDEFERILDRVGKESNTLEPTDVLEMEKGYLEEGITDPEEMRREAQEFVDRIKKRKAEEMLARKEREQRRRKAMVEQQRLFREAEEKRHNEIMLEKLMRQSQAERELAKE